jgi:uncharacterized protein YecE (DUF72 family)
MKEKLLLGCSGWSYDEWVGTVYKNTKESKLAAYSNLFDIAEINSTFYRNPSKGTVLGWNRYTPEDFLFTAKMPQKVTHDKNIDVSKGIKEDMLEFCELMRPLQDSGKLACLLIQLPPRPKFKEERVRGFLEVLPEEYRYAIEFRNSSWMCEEAYELLREFKIAYTIVDEPLLPPEIHITSDFAYIRWHGKGSKPWYNYRYSVNELEPWIPKLKTVLENTERAYGFFNNHYRGYAPANCLQMLEMMDLITPQQLVAKKGMEDYIDGNVAFSAVVTVKPKTATIEDFKSKGIEDLNVPELLGLFMDSGRLRRAKAISDKELKILKSGQKAIEAKVRDYDILIDIAGRRIIHDCGDWSRCIPNKNLCKHVGKVLLSIPDVIASNILMDIHSNKELWEFGN